MFIFFGTRLDISLYAVVFRHQFIWNTWVPTKVGFFAWEAWWDKVLTLDQLKRRERALSNRCFLCREEEEMVDHLLVHCSKTRMLWDLFLAIVGVSLLFILSVREILLSWRGSFVGKRHIKSLDDSPPLYFLDYMV